MLQETSPGLIEYNQSIVSSYEQASPLETSPVLKFPSNKVEMLDEVNTTVRGTLTNYIDNNKLNKATPINASLQRNKMDVRFCASSEQRKVLVRK